ncbi:hypothetical protein BV508_30235, partial [Mycobacterium intermedium]
MAPGLLGLANIGFGNSGNSNIGFGNMGVGNIGFGNSGNGNFGIGLTGENLTGFGGFNTGSGNIGLFNSGTGNVGFFNSGTGNVGLFNSDSHNIGIGNSGFTSAGLFNTGGFNTGLANTGSYNSGSFNPGDNNSGGFNSGSVNTGWFNTGDINTGVANSGNVNTGAFIAGHYSNGVLWRGNYEGLIGPVSGGAHILPEMPLSLAINGGVGAITIQPIHILPEIPIDFSTTLYLGPLVVPDIHVPAFSLGAVIPNISIGPIKIDPITLWTGRELVNHTIYAAWPTTSITIPQIQQISPPPGLTTLIGPIHINMGFSIPLTFSYSIPSLTLFPNGLSIPDAPLTFSVGAAVSTDAFTIPGFSIPEQALPLRINVLGHIDALSTPAITIDNIPLNLHATGHAGPVGFPGANIPAVPGFGNATTAPSSGFFNTGAGGSSGFGNVGAQLSGWFNQMPQATRALLEMGPGSFPQILPLGGISEIPVDLQVGGGIGPIHVQPIRIPEFNLQITGGFIGLGEFTLPQIDIPAIPIHVTGFVELDGFQVSATPILGDLGVTARMVMDPVALPNPFITIENYGPQLGTDPVFPRAPFYLSIRDVVVNVSLIGGGTGGGFIPLVIPFELSVSPLTLFPNGASIPAQTVVNVDLTGGLDSITLFPGGLHFPRMPLVSLTNFVAGTNEFTLFPQGFTVDTIPVNLHTTLGFGPIPFGWGSIAPTPANGPIPAAPGGIGITSGLFPLHFNLDGGIGPISIPTTTVFDAINPLLTVTGNVAVGPFVVPDIPLPAINLGLDGAVDVNFTAPNTTLLSGLEITGGLDIPPIQVSVATEPLEIYIALGELPIPTLLLFELRSGVGVIVGTPHISVPIDVAGFSLPVPDFNESIPLNLSFGSPASTIKSMVLGLTQPIDLSVDLDAVSIPATVVPAIPLNISFATPVGPINIPIFTTPGSENSTGGAPAPDPFSGLGALGLGLGVPGLGLGVLSLLDGSMGNSFMSGFNSAIGIVGPNVGLGDLGVGNIGLGNIGDFNLGGANIGEFNFGGGNVGSNNFGLGNIGVGNIGFANSGGAPNVPGMANVGFGNVGSNNSGLANMGVGNVGFANSGSGNFGIGLTGDNLTGFGSLNTGYGNIGLFNSGTGNIGFFNSGTGNFGLFNSGDYNTGIGNSGIASTGLFNAGGFN